MIIQRNFEIHQQKNIQQNKKQLKRIKLNYIIFLA